jgi:hypothetical protein
MGKKKLDLGKLVPALEFYGTGDEAYELFATSCSFCYQLFGLGDRDKAEIVYGWAKEMADCSKEWYFRERKDDLEKTPGCDHEFDRETMKYCSKCGKQAWYQPSLDMEYGRWGY